MPVCRDPDNDGRNVPARMARGAGLLPRLDLLKDAVLLNFISAGIRVPAALAGYIRDVSAKDRKPFVDTLVDDHLTLRAGSRKMVEVPMIRLPAVAEYP